MRYAGTIVSILDFAIFITSIYFWRFLWEKIPSISEIYFPDINGIWEGKIVFGDEPNQERKLQAKVRIKQNLWKINMDLCSTTSKSCTLIAYPTIEAGNHKLYYVYQNTPKNPEFPEYKGTSILGVSFSSEPMEMKGQYYTIRGTKGRIELRRESSDPKGDYELY